MSFPKGWIGVDFDGTLAMYTGWQGDFTFGKPIPKMVDKINHALGLGYEVKIFTARVSVDEADGKTEIIKAIQNWLVKAGLPCLEVTNIKDFRMVELWDDRAVQVKPNTGEFVGKSTCGIF